MKINKITYSAKYIKCKTIQEGKINVQNKEQTYMLHKSTNKSYDQIIAYPYKRFQCYWTPGGNFPYHKNVDSYTHNVLQDKDKLGIINVTKC